MVSTFWYFVQYFHKAFSRQVTFFWFITFTIGFIKAALFDDFGAVSSHMKGLKIMPKCYIKQLFTFSNEVLLNRKKLIEIAVDMFFKKDGPFIQ